MDIEVHGAGTITISDSANACCANRAGFLFGVSWGRYGKTGGVLNREEAKKLADHIYSILETCTDTEEECHARIDKFFEEFVEDNTKKKNEKRGNYGKT